MRYDHNKVYSLLSVFLGFLGILNFIAVGVYLCYLCFNWPSFDPQNFVLEGYLAFALTVTGVAMLVYGSFLTWKDRTLGGGITNLVAGMLLLALIYYFFFITQPSFLDWLGAPAFSLPIPPLLSGLIGILLHRTTKFRRDFDVV